MPRFIYKAKVSPTEVTEGVVAADNLDDAVSKITGSGYIPIEVQPEIGGNITPTKTVEKKQGLSFSFFKRIPLPLIALFTRQFCDLLDAGVPLIRSITLLERQITHVKFHSIIREINQFVQEGGSLGDAMAKHPNAFSALYVNMVRSGEISGNLPEVLDRLATFTEQDIKIRANVRSALMYPSVIFVIGIVTMFVLFSFVLPRLTVMFDDFGADLPAITKGVIAISNFFVGFWWAILLVTVAGVFYAMNFFQSPNGKMWLDRTLLKVPVIGAFLIQVELGRFSRTLGTLIDSGVPIVQALESVTEVMENVSIKEMMQEVTKQVVTGSTLSAALETSPFFNEMTMSMLAVGEESGKLQTGLFKLADACERETENLTKTFVTMLGPMVLILVVGFVGLVIVAMLLPIFRINLIIS